MPKILFVFGTRPEAIKLCPVVLHLKQYAGPFEVRVCVTGQHRGMLDQVLEIFGVEPDYDLNVMLPGQTLFQSSSRILTALEPVLKSERPRLVLVQGDTTTTLFGALAAFYLGIASGHVEAGLRTGDMSQPFPEEMNRVLTTRLATLHFAATRTAACQLRAEAVEERRIFVTGNPGIDAVMYVRGRLEQGSLAGRRWDGLDPSRKLIVVTAHRRESFGEGFEQICSALRTLAGRPDVQIVIPVHPNPLVQEPIRRYLAAHPNIIRTEPLDYVSFVDLMRRAHLLLTDSGGIQEEGPSLGKPVLVMRNKTERPEAVEAGTAKLVGPDSGRIVAEASRLLEDAAEYRRMSQVHNPYGDGRASERIAQAILQWADENQTV